MSSTPDREHQDDAAPATGATDAGTGAGTGAEATTTADSAPTPSGTADAPGATDAPGTPDAPGATDARPTPATPSRGTSAHRASRPAPVPPAPEDPAPELPAAEVSAPPAPPATTGSTTAVVSDGSGAPTAPLPAATGTPPSTTAPASAPTTPVPPAEAVRRTSFRGAEARAAAVLVTGTPAAAHADDPLAPTPDADALDTATLPGTGPSDASVPYGDPSAPATPREPLPVVPAGAAAPAEPARPETRSRRDTAAGPPARRPGGGIGRHLAGVLVGLLVGAVGVWTVVFGQSRVLAAQAPGWDASYDVVGVLLVTVGVLVLAAVLGLGLWTPAVPLTAGLVASVVGVVLLYVPATTHVDVVRWFATDGTRGSVVRATVTATSGAVFVVGALLLAAGLVLAVARRRWLPRV